MAELQVGVEGEPAMTTAAVTAVTIGHAIEGEATAMAASLPSNALQLSGEDPPPLKRKRAEEGVEEEATDVPIGDEADESRSSVLAAETEAPAEVNPRNPMWKTSFCSYFRRQKGTCNHGDSCRYAHSEEELRPRPDNTWDPNSMKAKTLKDAHKIDAGQSGDAMPVDGESNAFGCSEGSGNTSLYKCLIGLPMKWTSDNLKQFLESQGISYKTAKKKKGMAVGFVGFSETNQVKIAAQELNGKSVGGKILKVSEVNHRISEKKHLSTSFNDQSDLVSTESESNKDLAISTKSLETDAADEDNCLTEHPVSKARSARDVATPLANMPYNEQLEHKKNSLLQTLKRLTRNARKACPVGIPLPDWVYKAREIGGLPCKLEGILESPMTSGYRNKCEFSVGYSLEGKKTVGFMLGNFREGMTAVMEPINCPNVSAISYKYTKIFQEFLQTSDLPIWNRIDNVGFWRQFTVREGRKPCEGAVVDSVKVDIAEVMIIVQVCTRGIDSTVINSEFKKMSEALAQGASDCSPPLPLTSLVVQDHTGISNAAPADCPLLPLSIPEVGMSSGPESRNVHEARIHDYISNLRFSISPTAFFQVNTLAAEKLYSLAGDWADLNSDTLLFDVCCGTGTIGLTLAHRVGMVVGIEMNDSAVSDAQRNAEMNGIKNCRFVCGKAEDVMGTLLKEYLDRPLEEQNEIDNNEDNGVKIDSELHHKEGFDLGENSKDGHQKSNGIASFSGNRLDEPFDDGTQSECVAEYNEEDNAASAWKFRNVVAIVDPPRGGLHPNVIKALRTHPRLRRLVYISCNPESLVANAIELCTPTSEKPQKGKANRVWRNATSASLARHRTKSMPNSEPFRPVKAMAVDLFPHTPHCEMVMLLER